jgi:hypothetical protein
MGVSKKGNKQKEYPMTRKDFQMIADILKAHTNSDFKVTCEDDRNFLIRNLALDLCVELKKDNPRFDNKRFLEACGVA